MDLPPMTLVSLTDATSNCCSWLWIATDATVARQPTTTESSQMFFNVNRRLAILRRAIGKPKGSEN
jgi:hypothetical protein